MLETIIVNTVMIPLLASVGYFWAAYSAKLGAMENARAAAWTYAYGGCQDQAATGALGLDPKFGTPTLVTTPGDNTLDDLTGIGRPVPPTGTPLDGQGPYLNIFNLPGYGAVLASATSQAPGQALLGIAPKPMPLTSHVRCNAVPTDATPWVDAFGTLHP